MGCSSSKAPAEAPTASKSKAIATEAAAGAKAKTLLSPETEAKSVKADVTVPASKASVEVAKPSNEELAQLDANVYAFDSTKFLRSVFDQIDADGDGAVSREELATSFERILDCSENKSLKDQVQAASFKKSLKIKSKKSFRVLLQEAGLNPDFYVFEQLDTNSDGRITWEEFEACLKPTVAQQDIKESVTTFDTAGQEAPVIEETEASASVKCLCGGW